MKLVTAVEMRTLEERAKDTGVSTAQLMENAGLAIAQESWLLLGTLEDRVILVLVGPGNNGGDGLVAARHLHDWGAAVHVYLTRARPHDDHARALSARGVPLTSVDFDPGLAVFREWLAGAQLVIDALLGTGRARPIEGILAEVLDQVGAARRGTGRPKLLAVDLPSGVDADTGAADPHTVAADATVTLGVAKVGLYAMPAAQFVGRVQTVEIGIPTDTLNELPLSLLTSPWVRDRLPRRPADSNKGTFGKVLLVAGSRNYLGAAYLSAAAAYRIGAGLVTLAVTRATQAAVVPMLPEATFLPLDDHNGMIAESNVEQVRDALDGYDVLLIGCGLGQDSQTQEFVRKLLYGLGEQRVKNIVVDADGLNALAADDAWPQGFQSRAILTPHPGEFSRLASLRIPEVQSDRVSLSRRHAAEWNKIVVLKGAFTVIASPDGQGLVSPFANSALATAGTGDVLAGAIAGLAAQGLDAVEAAACGVFLHAAAGELMAQEFGDAGGLAGDLPRLLPEARRRLLQNS